MRGVYSQFSSLPFIRDTKFLYKEQCSMCNPAYHVPASKGVPNFFLRFINPEFTLSIAIVRDSCTQEQVDFFTLQQHIELYQGDEYHFYSFVGNNPLSAGQYYIQIPVILANPYSFVSEEFCVKPDASLRYKLQWTNECNDLVMGGYNSFFNEFYLDEINFNQPVLEREYIEKKNDEGIIKRTNNIITTKPNFNVIGNDWIYESLTNMTNYKSVQLENLINGELYDLTNVEITPNGTACEYPIEILFTQNVATDNKCCPVDDPFIDPCINRDCLPVLGDCVDCIPPSLLNCDGWEITWYTDPELSTPLIGNFSMDADTMYYYEITKEGCDSLSGDYWHDAPDAGDPINPVDLS